MASARCPRCARRRSAAVPVEEHTGRVEHGQTRCVGTKVAACLSTGTQVDLGDHRGTALRLVATVSGAVRHVVHHPADGGLGAHSVSSFMWLASSRASATRLTAQISWSKRSRAHDHRVRDVRDPSRHPSASTSFSVSARCGLFGFRVTYAADRHRVDLAGVHRLLHRLPVQHPLGVLVEDLGARSADAGPVSSITVVCACT